MGLEFPKCYVLDLANNKVVVQTTFDSNQVTQIVSLQRAAHSAKAQSAQQQRLHWFQCDGVAKAHEHPW